MHLIEPEGVSMEALELILLIDTVQFPCQMQLSFALDCPQLTDRKVTDRNTFLQKLCRAEADDASST